MNPSAWIKQRNPQAKKLRSELLTSKKEVTLSQLKSIVPNWTKVCFFGPYTTEKEAAKVLGYYSATMEQSAAHSSDGVTALVFINDSGTIAILDVKRSVVDFSPLSKSCLSEKDFPLL